MGRIEETTGVPDNKVDEVMEMFRNAGATEVTKKKENGTWIVTAKFPNGDNKSK